MVMVAQSVNILKTTEVHTFQKGKFYGRRIIFQFLNSFGRKEKKNSTYIIEICVNHIVYKPQGSTVHDLGTCIIQLHPSMRQCSTEVKDTVPEARLPGFKSWKLLPASHVSEVLNSLVVQLP